MTRRLFADPGYANKVKEAGLTTSCPAPTAATATSPTESPATAVSTPVSAGAVRDNTRGEEEKGGGRGRRTCRNAGGPRCGRERPRGHPLREGSQLGGALPLAAMVKGFEVEDLTLFIDFFKNQVGKQGVIRSFPGSSNSPTRTRSSPTRWSSPWAAPPSIPTCPASTEKRAQKLGPLRDAQVLAEDVRPEDAPEADQDMDARGEERGHHRRRHTGLPVGRVPGERGRDVTIVEYGKGDGGRARAGKKDKALLLVQEERHSSLSRDQAQGDQ